MSSRRGAARGRAVLLPADATNEGSRLLRELLRRMSIGALAKKLTCDEKTVRMWAQEKGKPSLLMRVRIWERRAALRVEIRERAWDDPPSADAYSTADPATSKIRS